MRVKSHWFKSDKPKSPEEVAGALAFISFRVAQNMLKSMRKAGFAIDPGPQYFDFLSEALVFCLQVSWRIAHGHFDEAGALAFMTALANRAGATLAENRADMLGEAGAADHKAAFVRRINDSFEEYGAFGYGPEGPDFAFLRYFASCIARLMGDKDERWAWDQVMAIEGPEAAATIAKAFGGLNETGPGRRARRPATTGE